MSIGAISRGDGSARPEDVQGKVNNLKTLFDESKGGTVEARNQSYQTLVTQYYDLVTSFYEYGWGQSFHFAPRQDWESLESSIFKHEYYLAHRLELKKGQKVLDVGCGVGGPARNIASFCDSNIVGINNNSYQITRAQKHISSANLSHLVSFVNTDFMHMDAIPDSTFDAAYSIESTCHAPDKVGVYTEIFKKLVPGGLYGSYEWVMTDKFEKENDHHQLVKKGIEIGDGIPNLEQPEELLRALKVVGFEIIEHNDMTGRSHKDYPWYRSLAGAYSIEGWRHTKFGRFLTDKMVTVLEACRIAPKGTGEVSKLLMETADHLVDGGREDIFTPMYFVLARKPEVEK